MRHIDPVGGGAVALSDEEQKLLQQMEAALAAEDPKLASTLRGGTRTPRTLQRKRAALAGFSFIAGCAMLIVGLRAHWAVSVLGFIIMVVSTVVAVTAYRRTEPRESDPDVVSTGQRSGAGDTSFMDKMEERWRRRQDEGL